MVLSTGCRPKEGAYVVQHKSIRGNDYIVKHQRHHLQAFMPASETKTEKDYLWLLPDEYRAVYD